MDFIDISLDSFIDIYGALENKLSNLWNKILFLKNEDVMYFKEFEVYILNIRGDKDKDNLWKFKSYFE
jgi:hypothetical protein